MISKRFNIEQDTNGKLWIEDTFHMYNSIRAYDYLFGNEMCYILNSFDNTQKKLLTKFNCDECSMNINEYCTYKHSTIYSLEPCEAFELKEDL